MRVFLRNVAPGPVVHNGPANAGEEEEERRRGRLFSIFCIHQFVALNKIFGFVWFSKQGRSYGKRCQ